MADEKPAKKKGTRRKKVAAPRGLAAAEVLSGTSEAIEELRTGIAADGGSVVGAYREPLGGMWQLIAVLPIEKVSPTPYQRDLSPAHVTRLAKAIEKLGRFMDPIVAVRTPDGLYWTPNGNHRLGAMKRLGAKAVTALVVPEAEVAHRILVLNTEKAHNVRERALEVIRLAEDLAQIDDAVESSYETEFEEPALLTLGCCYQVNGRFSGGAYQSVLKRVESFMDVKLSKALELRRAHAERLLELDAAVSEVVAGLKQRGFDSPYLKAFVIARINPLRWDKSERKPPFEGTIAKMLAAAQKFDSAKVKADEVARTGGAPDEA
jgi:ParB family transcriptional regulator, chromosome partitioning protein